MINTLEDMINPYQYLYTQSLTTSMSRTLIFSQYQEAMMNSLVRNQLVNLSGVTRIKHTSPIPAVAKISNPRRAQRFERVDATSDGRLAYFKKFIFPPLTKTKNSIVFVPTYFDFVRVRNWFIEYAQDRPDLEDLMCFCSEHTDPKDVTRNRGEFYNEKKRVMVTTERFYFYFRYRLRGAHRVVSCICWKMIYPSIY